MPARRILRAKVWSEKYFCFYKWIFYSSWISNPNALPWPFLELSFEVATCATRSFKGLFGSTQQNISVLYSNPIAVLPATHQKNIIFLIFLLFVLSQPFSSDHCSPCSLPFSSLPVSNKTYYFLKLQLSAKPIGVVDVQHIWKLD